MRFVVVPFLFVLLGLGSGCTTLHFVTQAAAGQWELASASRPIPEVIADPRTPALTRRLLSEVEGVRRFAWQNGLKVSGNYKNYVWIDREYPIWFVNASAPLAFRAKVFTFPIVGSFPGLSWFDKKDAEAFRDALLHEGWDVNMRGVSAFLREGGSTTPSSGACCQSPQALSLRSSTPCCMSRCTRRC